MVVAFWTLNFVKKKKEKKKKKKKIFHTRGNIKLPALSEVSILTFTGSGYAKVYLCVLKTEDL